MSETLNAILTALVGFALPLIVIGAYVLYGMGTLPITMLAMTWLGFAIFFYVGLADEGTAA